MCGATAELVEATWPEAFSAIAGALEGLKGDAIAAVAGDQADCEAMCALKDLMADLGSTNLDCRQDGAALDPSVRAGYIFNTTIAGIDRADACLLIGTDPRREAPVLNARLRKRYLAGGFPIGVVGPTLDLTYRYEHLGDDPKVLKSVANGRHAFAKVLKAAERPMLILGQGALARPDGAAILALARKIAESRGMIVEKTGWNGFNVLHMAAARVGGLDLGFVPGAEGRDLNGILDGAAAGDIRFVYLLGADEIAMDRLGKAFVVYQGHHGDAGAARADVILPGAAYTEKNATYVNTEGRVQRTHLATFAPGEAREDWKIVRALSEVLGKPLAFDTLGDVRARMENINPAFMVVDGIAPAEWAPFGTEGDPDKAPLTTPIDNYYRTDPISRASPTMARCTAELLHGETDETRMTGTDA